MNQEIICTFCYSRAQEVPVRHFIDCWRLELVSAAPWQQATTEKGRLFGEKVGLVEVQQLKTKTNRGGTRFTVSPMGGMSLIYELLYL